MTKKKTKTCVFAGLRPQLSLFENDKCTQCGCDVDQGHVYCEDCAEAWAEKYLNPDQLDPKK